MEAMMTTLFGFLLRSRIVRASTATVLAAGALVAQETRTASCPANQRAETRLGFESFDCEGCKLRRDPETGVAYVEFTKPPVLRGIAGTPALRDGDVLTHIDGTSITTAA